MSPHGSMFSANKNNTLKKVTGYRAANRKHRRIAQEPRGIVGNQETDRLLYLLEACSLVFKTTARFWHGTVASQPGKQ